MKRFQKIRSQSGFSLAETLLAVLILLLVAAMASTGISAVQNAYDKVVLGANAQAMLGTAVTALRDEFGTAYSIDEAPDGSKSITYFKAGTGAKATVSCTAENDAISIQDYILLDSLHNDDAKTGKERKLVPDTNTGLYVHYDSVSYKDGIVNVKELSVRKKSNDKPITALESDLLIRVLSVEPTKAP